MYDMYGFYMTGPKFSHDEAGAILAMFKPVRCTCGQIYDIGKVEVTARYADCSAWRAPCCGRTADDRGETGWKTTQDYTVIDKADLR